MDPINFFQFVQAAKTDLSPEELFERAARNKVDALNAMVEANDGTGIDCPVCKGKGWFAFFDDGTKEARTKCCSCYGPRITARRLKTIGLLDRSRRCTFDGFKTDTPTQSALKTAAVNFTNDATGEAWLALFGQSGVGKTHLCLAAFSAVIARRNLTGEYMRWNTDARAVKAAALEENNPLFDKFKEVPLLYVDDLFKKRADAPVSDADLRLAFELLDARYNSRLPTILSCELTFEELVRLDEAIAGRIREMCGPYLVSVGRDMRKNYRFQAS